jgi:hypothetical protein
MAVNTKQHQAVYLAILKLKSQDDKPWVYPWFTPPPHLLYKRGVKPEV